jgi:hypothetical protein
MSKWTRPLVWIGEGLGLVLALGLSGVRVANLNEPLGVESLLGSIAFAVVYAAPFALSLWALSWKNARQQAAVWLAGGLLALLESFTAFSGASLVFLPIAPLLMLAALGSAVDGAHLSGLHAVWPILPVSVGVVGVGVAAFLVLITLTSDPRCWVLNRYPDGHTSWARDFASEAQMTVTRGPNGETVMGSGQGIGGPPVNGIERVSATCTSDVISPVESAASVGLWAFAGAALFGLRRIWMI